jgi:hypothetical protein
MQRIVVVSLFLGVLSLGCATRVQEPALHPIVAGYLHALRRGDVAAASRLFHYPENEQGAELEKDRLSVADGIRVLHQCFGEALDAKEGFEGAYMDVGLGGGDLPHWDEHPEVMTLDLTVKFRTLGPGKLSFDLIRLPDGTSSLRQVKYGLPLNDPLTESRLDACGKAAMSTL